MPTYKGPGEPTDPQEKPLDYEGFKALLIESVNKYPTPENRLPKAIDAGEFGRMAQSALKEQLADPRRRERRYVVVATLDGGLKMTIKPTVGTIDNVSGEYHIIERTYADKPEYNRSERFAMGIHSHEDNHPPSVYDCGNLIVDPEAGVAAQIIATTEGYYLVMRTLEGVDFEKSVAEVEKWKIELKEELIKRLSIINSQARDAFESRTKQVMAMRALFNRICVKYHLAVYTSPDGIIFNRTTL